MTRQSPGAGAAGPGAVLDAAPGSHPDAEETARIEARLLALGEAQVREMRLLRKAPRKSSAPLAPSAPRKASAPVVLPRPVRWAALALAGWTVLGTVAALSPLGRRFIWFGAADYLSLAWSLAAVLLPVFAAFWFWTIRGAQAIRSDGMTWAGRWLGVFPGCVALATAMVLVAPWGWSAMLGWTLGTPTRVQVRVVSFKVPEYYRGCHLRAAFEFSGATSPDACVDGRFKGDMPPVGSAVTVYGKRSRWGLTLGSIHDR